MMCVTGIGWVDASGWGQVRSHTRVDGLDHARMEAHLAAPPAGREIRNYGRFTLQTRRVIHALHHAQQDAGLAGPADYGPHGAGLMGAGEMGAQAANVDYYRDFRNAGGTLARGNLFLYTLPTSPLAEAAMHFHLEGPLFWVGGDADDLPQAFASGRESLDRNRVSTLFVCHGQADAVALYTLCAGGRNGLTAEAVLEGVRTARARNGYPGKLSLWEGTPS